MDDHPRMSRSEPAYGALVRILETEERSKNPFCRKRPTRWDYVQLIEYLTDGTDAVPPRFRETLVRFGLAEPCTTKEGDKWNGSNSFPASS